MSDKYRIIVHTDECVNRFQPKYSKAQKFLDSEVLRCSAPYVPMRTGFLMKSGDLGTKLGSGEVIYNAPYARAMYYGDHFNFSKDKHPQACARWFEKAKAVNKDAWMKGVQKLMEE